jgi:cytosine permease
MVINEHTQGKISQADRLGVIKLAMIWAGFPFILAITITGSLFAISSTPFIAASAIFLGSVIMFFYVGILGDIGWREGRSFAQIAEVIFGRIGYKAITVLLSTLVLGWFTINTAMPSEILASSFHISYWIVALFLGAIFVVVTAFGIQGMNIISNLSVPLFAILIIVAFLVLHAHHGIHISPTIPTGTRTLTFSEVLAGVLASFADSGTLAPDFNRWAKNRKTSWISVFAAFPLGFGIAMLSGVVFTVMLAKRGVVFNKPFQESNPVGYLIMGGGTGLVFAVLVAAINQGSNATHCLYNSGIGFSKLVRARYVLTTLIIGTIGITIAVTGVWALLIDWLKVIGILVPPIGSVIIVSYYTGVYRLRDRADVSQGKSDAWSFYPWIALLFGWTIGLGVNFTSLALIIPVPVASFAASLLVMFITSLHRQKKLHNVISHVSSKEH